MESEQVATAVAAIPRLSDLVDRLLAISERIHRNRVQHDRDDRVAAMVLGFTSKQHEHLRSVRVLTKAGQDRDVTLIARTMVEGSAQLLFAFNNRPTETDRWYWYAAIEDWRQLRRQADDGLPVDEKLQETADELIAKYGPDYYSRKARERIEEGKTLPSDPFRHGWSDLTAADMFNKMGLMSLYQGTYRSASDWIHWTHRSILLAVDDSDDNLRGYEIHDPRCAAIALSGGYQSLLFTLSILDSYFSLGIGEELSQHHAEFRLLGNELGIAED